MAYDNGYIHGNMAIADIQRALRTSKCDIGSLATDAERINKWAKYKPQAVGGVEDITERDRSDDSYYPWGRAWVETADYAEFVWQFPNLLPNIATAGGGGIL